MKIRIERLEIEVPGFVEKLADLELEKDRSHYNHVGGLVSTITTLLSEYLKKLVINSSDVADPDDVDDLKAERDTRDLVYPTSTEV